MKNNYIVEEFLNEAKHWGYKEIKEFKKIVDEVYEMKLLGLFKHSWDILDELKEILKNNEEIKVIEYILEKNNILNKFFIPEVRNYLLYNYLGKENVSNVIQEIKTTLNLPIEVICRAISIFYDYLDKGNTINYDKTR
ncbi:MAG: hypothetical protein NC921_03955 [Candidatus Omnitrophica bacterium]|nr:hypothetical protein [Candidatus Omnitrophota bacterium]